MVRTGARNRESNIYRNLTKLSVSGMVPVTLLALGGTLLSPFLGQALAQSIECGDGKSELVIVLPNGTEKSI